MLFALESISRSIQLKDVLIKCMDATEIVMHAEASSLMLLDEVTGNLNVSIPTGPVKNDIIGKVIPKDKGIGGWVVAYNRPFISNDVMESDIFWKDLTTNFTTRNIICVPLRDEDGTPFGVLQALNKKNDEIFTVADLEIFEALASHVAMAITRSRQYDKLESKVKDRELQLREIHHRLKNSLAMISGLLEFDVNDSDEVNAKLKLNSAQTRIKALAEAHALLYEQDELTEIDLSQYLEMVTNSVQKVFYMAENEVEVYNRLDECMLDANRSMLCGQILNELLINAYKYAFNRSEQGELIVSLKVTDEQKIVMIVTDNGHGFESIPEVREGKPNGKFIIQSLVQKLNGEISYVHNKDLGTTCILSFMK